MAFEKLFSPMKIGPVEIKNRTIMAPMAVCLAPDINKVTDVYVQYFGARAKGGFGLVTTCGVAVDLDNCGLPEPGAFSLTKREDVDQVKRIVDIVHAYGGKLSLQLLHPGRQGSKHYAAFQEVQTPVAPSAIKEADWADMPRELTVDEITEIVNKYAFSASLAFEAGVDGVDIHCAHGYLISSFLSPRSNKREDEYGGSLENRMRFMDEIIDAVMAVRPADRFVSARINTSDGLEGGLEIDECLEIAKHLEAKGIHALSISNGTYSAKDLLIEPQVWDEGCRTEVIKKFKAILNIPLIAVNHVKRPAHAEEMLEEGLCDFVCLGRASMADPEWPNKAQSGRADLIRYCVSCGTCNAFAGLRMPNMCAMNPYNDNEYKFNERTFKKDGNGRKVVVIGGGLGAMEAATLAAERGFSVKLFCKDSHLGGAFNVGSYVPGMEKKGYAVTGYINRLTAAGVNVKLNTEITSAEQVLEMNPYAVIVATGATPVVPEIPGVDKAIVKQSWDVAPELAAYKGKKVIFVGSGLTGIEVAYGLASKGADVAIYEAADMITPAAKGVSENKNKKALMDLLVANNASFHTSREIVEVTDNGAIFRDTKSGELETVEGDAVVLSLGIKPNTAVEDMLKGKVEKLIVTGDCTGTSRVFEATHTGFEAVWDM